MRLLLDTHTLLWALATPARLPAKLAAAIREPSNVVYVSAASGWAPHHRDPFDRMLVAQALEERLSVATRDRQLAAYGVPTVWA